MTDGKRAECGRSAHGFGERRIWGRSGAVGPRRTSRNRMGQSGQLRTPIPLSIRRPNGELLNQSLVGFEWRKFFEAMHGASGCPWKHFTRIAFDKRRTPRRIVKHCGTEIHKLHAIDSCEDPTHTARTKVVPRMPVQTSDNRLPVCDEKCGAWYRSAE